MHDDFTKMSHAPAVTHDPSMDSSPEDLAHHLLTDLTAHMETGRNGAHTRHIGLAPHHYEMLAEDSGIAPHVMTARGYFTATRKAQLAGLGFGVAQRLPPALIIPIRNAYGDLVSYQARPDAPRVRDGHPVKYETPSGSRMVLDVPPLQQNRLRLQDPAIPLWITEGCKKADALVTHDCCAIALLGVWNWRGTNDAGGKTVLADFETIALNNGRLVYLCFDSDVMTKPEVHKALERFAGVLESRGAAVRYIYLPSGASGAKVGVDDYLVAGHHVDALLALATSTLRPLSQEEAPAIPYQATPHGLVWLKQTKDGMVPTQLTNFTARIVTDITEDNGAEVPHLFELEARRNGHTVRFKVPAAHFPSMGWVTEHLGATAMVMPGMMLKDHARAAIQILSQDVVRERRVYTHTGWRKIDDAWYYLHAAGAIGSQGAVPDIAVDLTEALAHYRLPTPPEGATERGAILASLRLLDVAPAAVTIPLFASIWRAVLGDVDCSLHLVGPTGEGKSALAALVQQHYGAHMTARHLPASWTSTGNALEGLAFEAKDAVLVVDDFCPTGSHADIQRYHREADRLLRAQGNQSGRQRMRPDSTITAMKPPRGLILSTGEDIPRGQSLRARVLLIEVSPGIVQWDKMMACQQDAATGVYAQTLAGFVRWLAPHYSALSQGVPTELVVLRQQALHGGHRRTPEMMAHLALGLQYFLAYAHDRGALTSEECQAQWERGWTALGAVAALQQEHQASEEPVSRFVALLAGAMAAGQAHVANASTLQEPPQDPESWGWRARLLGTGVSQRQEWHPLGACVGWVHGTRLYLEPEAAFSVAQKLAETQKAPLPITQQTLWKRMHEQGLLVRDPSQDKNKVKRTVGQKRTYIIDIDIALLSPETGTSGTSGTPSHNCNENNARNGHVPYRFPVWYGPQPVQPLTGKPVQPTAANPVPDNGAGLPESCTGFSHADVPVFSEGPVQKNSPQPIENPSSVPVVPEVPVPTVYRSPRRTTDGVSSSDPLPVFVPQAADASPLPGDDRVGFLSADGAQQNPPPYRIRDMAPGSDGRLSPQFADSPTGELLDQCERATPPAWASPVSSGGSPEQRPLASLPPEAPPVSTVDDSGGASALAGMRRANPCPQCGCGQWLLGATSRLCAACGYKDGAGRETLR
jgi:hypothetical protein